MAAVQIDPCHFCAEPALAWFALQRLDEIQQISVSLRLPLCEPHRASLAAAAARGRRTGDGNRWLLAER